MPAVEIVVPWRPGCPYRERAWAWLRPRLERIGRVCEAPGPDPWVKARAVMPAVAACPGRAIVAVVDADVWCDDLPAAVAAIEAGAGWAIPHDRVHRLTHDATPAVLAGGDWRDKPLAQKPYTGVAGGGIVVARRETLLDVPLDPRFVGWGQEDESWAAALDTLAGPPWRGTAPLVHLWHPPQQRLCRRRGSVEGWHLRRRYFHARDSPAAMRQLLDEALHALDAPEPALHDHPPILRR